MPWRFTSELRIEQEIKKLIHQLIKLNMSTTATAICEVFMTGKYTVNLKSIHREDIERHRTASPPPPKPVLISSPCEEGEFPVCVFLAGYLLNNSFYSQLLQHISSHGFIVVAPQLYTCAGPDSAQEISDAAKITDWLTDGLAQNLPNQVRPDLTKLAISGHSRGGKVAFALALGYAKTSLTFSALLAVDPVGGTGKGNQTPPPVLTYIPHSFDLKMAVLVIGSGLGDLKKNFFLPPCAPKGVSHREFYDECKPPACHLVAKDYGHMDTLDDETKGFKGAITYCTCSNGRAREPMRNFVGGAMVAFMRAYLSGEKKDLWCLKDNPELAIPIVLSEASFELE